MTPATPIPNRDLLATCWTWSGDSAPFRGDETSPLDFRVRVEAAARAGWAGLGILHADLIEAERQLGFAQLKEIVADSGIRIVELEFISDWWTTDDRRPASDRLRQFLFDAAAALDAPVIKVGGDLSADPVDLGQFTEAFAELAEDADRHGVRVALEPMAMNNLARLERGIQVVTEVNHPAGGLCVDSWHVHRGGTAYSSLPELLPIDSVFVVELADSREALTDADLWRDAVNHRLNPGDGELNSPGFVADMVEAGWTGHWGVEIISEAQRQLPLEDAITGTFQATSAVLDAAEQILRTRTASRHQPASAH